MEMEIFTSRVGKEPRSVTRARTWASWRVAPLNYQSPPFPNLQKVSDEKLFEWLASPSATRRLHVQREILRRDPQPGFIKNISALASSSRDLSIRAAAIFTLGQIQNPSAIKSLIKLSGNPELREIALRALTVSTNVPAKIFVDGLKDKNPAVRLQSIIALNLQSVLPKP